MAIYAENISGSTAFAGLVTGAFYLASLGMRPINGLLVDRYGSRPLLIVSTLLCAIACFCHQFALAIAILLICRFLHGIAFSVYTTAGSTAASNILPAKRLSEGMGYYTLGLVIATAIGPSIALSIIPDNTFDQFKTLFYAATAACAIAFLIMPFVHYGKKSVITAAVKKEKPKDLPSTFLGFEEGVIWPVIIGSTMLFAYSAVLMFLPLYGQTKGWNVGAFFTVYAMAMLLSRLFAGRIADKHGPDAVMMPAFVLAAVSYILIPFCGTLPMLCVVGFPIGMAQGILTPQISVFCITRCSRERRGSAASAYTGSLDLGIALGSFAMGAIIQFTGYTFCYLFCGALALSAMAVYLLTLSKRAKVQ